MFTDAKIQKSFDELSDEFKLNKMQQKQMFDYVQMLLEANKEFNLTAITSLKNVIDFHLRDSLMIGKYIDISKQTGVVDIGSGGGLPGIPLKICYPDVPFILIEVTKKKIDYLWQVIKTLNLDNIFVSELDWRTFLRKTEFEANLFCSRASLHTDELMRMLKPGCFYKDAMLVYWASKHWEPTKIEEPFLYKQVEYQIDNKERTYVFFKRPI